MDYNFDLKIFRRLNEGGNIFKGADKQPVTSRIDKNSIGPSLKMLEKILGFKLNNWLGSTGKKETSGDVDIGVDVTQHDRKEIANHLKAWAKEQGLNPAEWVKLSGTNVHFKLPIVTPKGEQTGEYAQVDLMFGNPSFMTWSMRGEPGNTYKGMHRHIIMASIAKAGNMKWSYLNGLVDRASNQVISQDPKEIAAKLLPGATVKDFDSVEAILNFIYKKYKNDPDTINKLLGDAFETLSQHYGITLPMPNQPAVNEHNDTDEYFLARLRDKIIEGGLDPLMEASTGGRPTQHIEDLIIFEGMDGLRRAIDILRSFADNTGHTKTSLKWDGTPALVFGRDEAGEFIFTDVSGFQVKSYDGKAKSPKQLMQILTQRGKGEHDEARQAFVQNMGNLFSIYEAATPPDFRGFLLGDLLYSNTPPVANEHYVFKPNAVEYSVVANSKLGKAIGASKTGIAIHKHFIGPSPLRPDKEFDVKKAISQLQGNDVLAMPPAFPQQSPKVNTKIVDQLEGIGTKYKNDINKLMDPNELASKKLKRFDNLIYKYINQSVSADMSNLGKDFFDWLPASGVSAKMQDNIKAHVAENKRGFSALWTIIRGLVTAKNDIAHQLDKSQTVIKQNMTGNAGRGEGYVVQHPDGPVKLVPRDVFTATKKAETH